jgi:drug/metabolite transporter (DMT)-like permease
MVWFYLAIGSAIIWGATAAIQKNILHGEHAISFATSSAIMTVIFSLILLPFIKIDFSLFVWGLLVLSGILSGSAYYLGAKGFKYLSLSEASPLYNLGTVIAVFLAVTLLGEKLTLPQMAGITLIILGTYVLELRGNKFFSPFIKVFKSEKIHFVLWATFLSSILTVLSKYILGFVEPLTFMFVHLSLAAAFLTLLVFTRHRGIKDIKQGFRAHKTAIILISLLTVMGGLTDVFALNLGEVALFLPVMRTWTLVAVIFGGTFYKEGHMRNRIIATTIMLVGVFIIYI